jgi:hypothetical protein
MCKEKNSDGEGAPIVMRVWHKGEGLQQVAAAASLLNLFWSTGGKEIPTTKTEVSVFRFQLLRFFFLTLDPPMGRPKAGFFTSEFIYVWQ